MQDIKTGARSTSGHAFKQAIPLTDIFPFPFFHY